MPDFKFLLKIAAISSITALMVLMAGFPVFASEERLNAAPAEAKILSFEVSQTEGIISVTEFQFTAKVDTPNVYLKLYSDGNLMADVYPQDDEGLIFTYSSKFYTSGEKTISAKVYNDSDECISEPENVSIIIKDGEILFFTVDPEVGFVNVTEFNFTAKSNSSNIKYIWLYEGDKYLGFLEYNSTDDLYYTAKLLFHEAGTKTIYAYPYDASGKRLAGEASVTITVISSKILSLVSEPKEGFVYQTDFKLTAKTDSSHISHLKFYDGDKLLGVAYYKSAEDLTYVFPLGILDTAGTRTIEAYPYDYSDNRLEGSASVNITVKENKLTSFKSDITEGTVNQTMFTFTAATDSRYVQRVDFYDGNEFLGSSTIQSASNMSCTFSTTFKTVGTKTIFAYPCKSDGSAMGDASTLTINVKEVEKVSEIRSFEITPPYGIVDTTNLTLMVTADNHLAHHAEFYHEDILIGSGTYSGKDNIYTYTAKPFTSEGMKLITAYLCDSKGNKVSEHASAFINVYKASASKPKVYSVTSTLDKVTQSTYGELKFTAVADSNTKAVSFYDGDAFNCLWTATSFTVSGDNRIFETHDAIILRTLGVRTIYAYPVEDNTIAGDPATTTVIVEPVKITMFTSNPETGIVNRTNFTFNVTVNSNWAVDYVELYEGDNYLGKTTNSETIKSGAIFKMDVPPFKTAGTKTITAYMYDIRGRLGQPASLTLTINNASTLPTNPKIVSVMADTTTAYRYYGGVGFSAIANAETENVAFYQGTKFLGKVSEYTAAGSNRMFDLSRVIGSVCFNEIGEEVIYAYPCDYDGKTIGDSYGFVIVSVIHPELYGITATPQSGNIDTTAFYFEATAGGLGYSYVKFYEGSKYLCDGYIVKGETINGKTVGTYRSTPIYFNTADPKTITVYLTDSSQTPVILSNGGRSVTVNLYPAGWQKIQPVTANPSSGVVSPGTKITLTCATQYADIYYTTDGTMPDVNSVKYLYPITVSESTTIKAVAVRNGMIDSDIAAFKYVVENTSKSLGLLDIPAPNQAFKDIITVAGWYMSTTDSVTDNIRNIEIFVDDVSYGDAGRFYRQDVDLAIKGYGDMTNCGFKKDLSTFAMENGEHQIAVKIYNKSGVVVDILRRSIYINKTQPSSKPFIGFIDTPAENAIVAGKITVTGWALFTNDGSHNGISRIDVYMDNELTAGETTHYSRPDVENTIQGYGDYSKSGYRKEIDITGVENGTHIIYVRGYNADGAVLGAFAKTINVQNGAKPMLTVIDSPVNNSYVSGIVNISGWALFSPDGVHNGIQSIKIVLNERTYDTVRFKRDDVERAIPGYGDYSECGFLRIIDVSDLPDGHYYITVVVQATDGSINSFVTSINIGDSREKPFLTFIDSPTENETVTGTDITVAGWSLYTKDGVTDGIDRIEVLVNNRSVNAAVERYFRPDLESVLSGYGDYSRGGYSITFPAGEVPSGTAYISIKFYGKDGSELGTVTRTVRR